MSNTKKIMDTAVFGQYIYCSAVWEKVHHNFEKYYWIFCYNWRDHHSFKATAWCIYITVSAVKTMCYLKPSLTSFLGVPSLINLRHKLWEFLMGRSFFWFRFWWLFDKYDVKARQTWELLTALRSIWSQLFRLQSPECAQQEESFGWGFEEVNNLRTTER